MEFTVGRNIFDFQIITSIILYRVFIHRKVLRVMVGMMVGVEK